MKLRTKILSYSVLQNAISIRLLCDTSHGLIGEPKDERRRVSLDELVFEAKVRSVNIQREETNVLLRTKKSRYIASKLFELMGRESLEFSITSPLDGEISRLLRMASSKLGEPEDKLLFKLTTFTDREGREVPGKSTIQELSEGQKSFLLRKLRDVLQENSTCLGS